MHSVCLNKPSDLILSFFIFTGSNVVSVAEHVVMMILTLVRNYMPAHKQVIDGEWDVAKIAAK